MRPGSITRGGRYAVLLLHLRHCDPDPRYLGRRGGANFTLRAASGRHPSKWFTEVTDDRAGAIWLDHRL